VSVENFRLSLFYSPSASSKWFRTLNLSQHTLYPMDPLVRNSLQFNLAVKLVSRPVLVTVYPCWGFLLPLLVSGPSMKWKSFEPSSKIETQASRAEFGPVNYVCVGLGLMFLKAVPCEKKIEKRPDPGLDDCYRKSSKWWISSLDLSSDLKT
jgi:hypothetical protein